MTDNVGMVINTKGNEMRPKGMRIETVGRRHYLRGLPYEQRHAAKAAGCRWDPQERAWWSGSRPKAEAALADAGNGETGREETGGRTVVVARVRYTSQAGRASTCYQVGRVIRGRTRWDDRAAPVESRDGSRVLLASRDGARTWWAETSRVEVVRRYERPKTIDGLRRYAEEARANGGTHPDACSCCGSTSCSAAYGRGGLCDED